MKFNNLLDVVYELFKRNKIVKRRFIRFIYIPYPKLFYRKFEGNLLLIKSKDSTNL